MVQKVETRLYEKLCLINMGEPKVTSNSFDFPIGTDHKFVLIIYRDSLYLAVGPLIDHKRPPYGHSMIVETFCNEFTLTEKDVEVYGGGFLKKEIDGALSMYGKSQAYPMQVHRSIPMVVEAIDLLKRHLGATTVTPQFLWEAC